MRDAARSLSAGEQLEPELASALLVRLRDVSGDGRIRYAEAPTRLLGGYSADLYRLRLESAPAELSGDLVLRLMRGADDAVREINVQREVAKLGFPAPAVRFSADSSAGLGRPFMLMDRVEGRTLFDASPIELCRLPRVLGETMLRLHALTPGPIRKAFSAAGRAGEALGAECVLAEVREAIAATGSSRLANGASWLIESRPPRASEVVCHGDLHPGNLLARDGQVVALLDWELATIEEPEFDVAHTLVLMRSAPGGDSRLGRWLRQRLSRLGAQAFLSAYASADPQRLRWYEALHCLRLVALVVKGRVGSERQSGRLVALWAPLADALAKRFRRLSGVALAPIETGES